MGGDVRGVDGVEAMEMWCDHETVVSLDCSIHLWLVY